MKKLVLSFAVALCLVGVAGIAGVHDHGNGHVCPVTGKTVSETVDVELTGEVLCMHCDLAEAESCHKIFIASDDQEIRFEICPEGDVDISTTHGPITVSGQKVVAEDGTMMLKVKSVQTAEKSDS